MNVSIWQGDILDCAVDVVVNPANEQLAEGGGLCGAIFGKVRANGGSAAHRELTGACRGIGHCPTGGAVLTPSFGLPAPFIIHAVGPVWPGNSPLRAGIPLVPAQVQALTLLKSTYESVLRLVEQHHLKSVAIPGISTGIFRFPVELAAAIATDVCSKYDADITVKLVAYDDRYFNCLKSAPSAEVVGWLASAGL